MIGPGDIETRAPFEGESLYGYVADITGMNKLGRVAEIAGAADRLHGHRPQLTTTGWDDLPALAAILDVDVAELQLRSYPIMPGDSGRRAFFGTTVARGDITTRVRRFSPAALAASPFHRAMWQLRLPFDVDTGEILLSHCPLCGKTQRWRHSAGVAFCDSCGESLDQPAERIDDDLRANLSAAIGLTHTDPSRRKVSLAKLPREISDLGAALAYELLLRLVPIAEPSCAWTGSDRIWNNDAHDIARGIHGAWELISGWPEAILGRIARDLEVASRGSDGTAGATRRFLKLRDYDFIAPELASLVGRLHRSIDTAGPLGADLKARTMTSLEVARYLRMGSQDVSALRRAGAFKTVGVARGSMLVPAFDREEVELIEREMHRRYDLNRVGAELGLPYYAVEQLCALNRLPLMPHPFFRARYSKPQITRKTARNLVQAITAAQQPYLEDAVSLVGLVRMVGGRLKPWDVIVEAMLDGGLNYTIEQGSTSLFQRIKVRREDIERYLELRIARVDQACPPDSGLNPHILFKEKMTKQDAAEVLNLSVREATNLLSGYPTRPDPTVPISDVLALAERYVTTVEIGTRLDVPYQRVLFAAKAVGIRRACDAGFERSLTAAIVDATIALSKRLAKRQARRAS